MTFWASWLTLVSQGIQQLLITILCVYNDASHKQNTQVMFELVQVDSLQNIVFVIMSWSLIRSFLIYFLNIWDWYSVACICWIAAQSL
jgi:hypothetical protein